MESSSQKKRRSQQKRSGAQLWDFPALRLSQCQRAVWTETRRDAECVVSSYTEGKSLIQTWPACTKCVCARVFVCLSVLCSVCVFVFCGGRGRQSRERMKEKATSSCCVRGTMKLSGCRPAGLPSDNTAPVWDPRTKTFQY